MHSVERLEQLLGQAANAGYVVRHEWLGGRGGGACEIAGRKHLFIDLAVTLAEQLEQAREALRLADGAAPTKLPSKAA
jgi:hypothetical protein